VNKHPFVHPRPRVGYIPIFALNGVVNRRFLHPRGNFSLGVLKASFSTDFNAYGKVSA
jgi:hypothetical protein